MKCKNLLLVAFVAVTSVAAAQTVEDANVSLGNLSSNLYYDNYDDNTKTVNNLNFVVLADGTNSSYVTPEFTISVYIWDGSNPNFVATYNDPGIYHFGSRDYVDLDIDLSSLGLPAGTYRIGVFVDADDDIPDNVDNPSDNAYLAEGDIVYTPGGSTAGIAEEIKAPCLSVAPNPASDMVHVSWSSGTARKLVLMSMNGQCVAEKILDMNAVETVIDLGALENGIYLVQVFTADAVITERLVKR